MLQAVLFDLNDTLIDFPPLDHRALLAQGARSSYDFFAARGCPLPPFPRFRRAQFAIVRRAWLRSLITRRESDILPLLARMCVRLGLPHDPDTVLEMAWHWYQPVTTCATCEPGLPALLSALPQLGFKIALVSNTFVPAVVLDRHLAALGLLEHLPVRIYSSQVRYRKPHRRIFELALEQLQVPPSAALFVGDSLKADIAGARRLGMTTVLKVPPGRPVGRADYVIPQLTQLSVVINRIRTTDPAP